MIRASRLSARTASTSFLSPIRTFNPTYGQTEFNYSYRDMAKIYLVTLAKETKSPFEPKSDEVKIKDRGKGTGQRACKEEGARRRRTRRQSLLTVKVDADGIQARIAEFPVVGATYEHLVSVGNKLYYQAAQRRTKRAKLMLYRPGQAEGNRAGGVRRL